MQTHFYLFDKNTHSINLNTFLVCEKSLKVAIEYIAKVLDVEAEIEALKEGGVISDFIIKVRRSKISTVDAIFIGIVLDIIIFLISNLFTADPEQSDLNKINDYKNLVSLIESII